MIGYYDESVFKDFIKEAASEFPNLPIKYLREYQALGTAGGLYHFRDAILKGRPERIFVLNSDVCCSFPLNEMAELFDNKDAEAVILGVYAAVAFRARADAPYTAEVLVLLAEAMDDELAKQLVGAVMLPLLRFEKRGELAATFMRSATIAEHRGDHALAAQRARAALRYFGEIKIERHLRIARRILSK